MFQKILGKGPDSGWTTMTRLHRPALEPFWYVPTEEDRDILEAWDGKCVNMDGFVRVHS